MAFKPCPQCGNELVPLYNSNNGELFGFECENDYMFISTMEYRRL